MHTINNLESIRQLLESRLNDAGKANGSRESIHIQQVADPVDMTVQAAERELAMHSLDRHTMLARQLRLAIGRIEDGTYGICGECEEEIAPRRLEAIPWAQLCIQCQEKADRSVQNGWDVSIPSDYSTAASSPARSWLKAPDSPDSYATPRDSPSQTRPSICKVRKQVQPGMPYRTSKVSIACARSRPAHTTSPAKRSPSNRSIKTELSSK